MYLGLLARIPPPILHVWVCLGLVTTTVMAIEATPKALDILAEASAQKRYDHGTDELDPMERIEVNVQMLYSNSSNGLVNSCLYHRCQ